jgi:2-desacetyl-2-hydroxyethyl bacteriochlorophyllide A dehydrogenase
MMAERKQQVGRLDGPRQVRLDTAEIPQAGPRGVVVKVSRAGICGTDLSFYRKGLAAPGVVLGHEFAGTVVAAGDAVSGIAPGDRVVANPMVDFLGLGGLPGAFAEYLQLPEARAGQNLFVLPSSVSDEAGALVEPFAVALHAINRADAQPGHRIVIHGAGPIGLCVLAALKARGVAGVLVVEPSALRRAMALAMGADAVNDPRDEHPQVSAAAHFGADDTPFADSPLGRADIAFDCAGVAASIEAATRSLRARGRLVLVADPHDCPLADLRLVMLRELEVIGASTYDDEFGEAIALLASGKVDLSPMVTHRFPLARLSDAFAMQMDAGQAGKVLIVPEMDR